MQTAIHFEGDQAYICVAGHGKIKEEDPISYGRSRVEFVIQTAKAQEEGEIGVVFDDSTAQIVKDAEEQCIRSGVRKGQIHFFTKEEAALGIVGFRGDDLLRGNSGIFDYTKKHFIYYEVKRQKDQIKVETTDYTNWMKHAVSGQEKDEAFLSVIRKALGRGITTTIYLCGEGFEGNWFDQATKALCIGRRVFMGKHLFASGVAYLCSKKQQSNPSVIMTGHTTISQIGLVVHHHGRDMFCPLIMEGKPWQESKGTMEIFVSGVNGLSFEVRNRSGMKKASIRMPLEGMKKDADIVYKLKIQGEYIKEDQCKIKITDLGFGKIRPASYQTWQQIIYLERGDF